MKDDLAHRNPRWARRAVGIAAALLLVMPVGVEPAPAATDGQVNVSGTPDQLTEKAKLEGFTFYVDAQTASGDPTEVTYVDGDGVERTRTKTKPAIAIYVDAVEGTPGEDVFAAYSRDDGATWARTNLTNAAALSSFPLANGKAAAATISKPALQVKGNKVFAAWTSPYCAGGSPRYEAEPEGDLYGVAGEQRSTDYSAEYPEVGELAHPCVWTVRGVVNQTTGVVAWHQPERLTSGERWAMQISIASAQNGGFGLMWTEDPFGVRPGEGNGPGAGWTGASVNPQSDVWYSFIPWSQFDLAANRMSMPLRISDNEAVPAAAIEQFPYMDGLCDATATAEDGVEYCVSDEGTGSDSDDRFFDGDTGATRPFLFLVPYQKPDLSFSAWAVVSWEESKGLGNRNEGDGDSTNLPPCGVAGKNVHYLSFDMKQAAANAVSEGTILNPQMVDEAGAPLWVDGELDWKGDPVPARESARRVRFIVQPKAQIGPSRTVMVGIYRMGTENNSGEADIIMHRWVVPPTDTATDNPYRIDNMAPGITNVSSTTPTLSWKNPETGVTKLVKWTQSAANLQDATTDNASESALGHRGFIKGDFLNIGYMWTPNWDLALDGQDVENYYVRRSFDGGQTFTSTPAALGGQGTRSCSFYAHPVTGERLQAVCSDLAAGAFEPARNLSRLSGLAETVIEPRLVGLPSTISGSLYPAEDTQDVSRLWQVWGTGANTGSLLNPEDTEDEGKQPADLFYAASRDYGDSYSRRALLAGGPQAQGEAQVRITPSGSRMDAIWNESGPGALDAFYRRVDLPAAPSGVDPDEAGPTWTPPEPTRPTIPTPPDVPDGLRRPTGDGYLLVGADGAVHTHGAAEARGSLAGAALNAPVVGVARHTGERGYWLVAEDGGIFAFGGAPFLGSMGGTPLNQPIVGMASTPSGDGYWLVAGDGGIFAFGDAPFLGSMGGTRLNQPIKGMAATPTGRGYWLVASDGGIFSFGDAAFHGSAGDVKLNRPIAGMAAMPRGDGYWLVATDGGVFTFGSAEYHGSMGGQPLYRPVVGMATTPSGAGYWLVARDGGVFTFGDARYHGRPEGTAITAIAVT
jgi:hypothetical protein